MTTTATPLKIDLLTNCCHSLKRGYELWEQWYNTQDDWLLKEAIFWIHHGIELAFKQLLIQTNEFLVVEELDKAVDKLVKAGSSPSPSVGALALLEQEAIYVVGFQKLVDRCAIILHLDPLRVKKEEKNLRAKIDELTSLRNKIAHFAVELQIQTVANLLADILAPLLKLLEENLKDDNFTQKCLPELRNKVQTVKMVNEFFGISPALMVPWFTGREEVLQQLDDQLKQHGTAILTGDPGIGKTQTAIQYAHQHRHDYRYVLWTEATSTTKFFSTKIFDIAKELSLPDHPQIKTPAKQEEATKHDLRHWLQQHTHWLLIVDDVDTLEGCAKINDFVPRTATGQVLFTTREQPVHLIPQLLDLKELNLEEKALLLLRRVKPNYTLTLAEARMASQEWEIALQMVQQMGRRIPTRINEQLILDIQSLGLVNYLSLLTQQPLTLRSNYDKSNH